MWGGSVTTRIAIAKEYARILTGLGIIYTMASLWDEVTIEDNAVSSDWGKIRIGNRRIDILAGVTQATVLLNRVARRETKSASGRIIPLSGDVAYGGRDISGVLGLFLRTKLTPVLGSAIDIWQGKDMVGNKVTLYDIPQKLLMPLSFGDIYDSLVEDGLPRGAALSILATFGVGVQIYSPGKR
jgi:hypothetical protein